MRGVAVAVAAVVAVGAGVGEVLVGTSTPPIRHRYATDTPNSQAVWRVSGASVVPVDKDSGMNEEVKNTEKSRHRNSEERPPT